MKIVTGTAMKQIDTIAVEEFKIPSIVLMENAALTVVEVIKQYLKDFKNPSVIVACGKGNNGGDGFAIARHLFQLGIDVSVIVIGNINSEDAATNFDIVKALDIPILRIRTEKEFVTAKKLIQKADLTVDSLLGTGIKGATEGIIKNFIDILNQNSRYTVAVDIPSGVEAETGKVCGNAVKANTTVTFALIKQGMLLYPAYEYVGKLIVTDIGIPKKLISSLNLKSNTIVEDELDSMMPKRKSRSNKGDYGKLLVLAGSKQMTGAAILVCKAAYRMGTGLVNLAAPEKVIDIAQTEILEIVNKILPSESGKFCTKSFDAIKDILNSFSAVAIGSGIGTGKEVTKFVSEFIYNVNIPTVIDADALNAVSNDINILKTSKAPIIVTPHPKEMSRLTGLPVDDILQNTVEIAKSFSVEYNVITVLKDSHTVIANPSGEIYINTTGNSAMSKGGSGDVLTGIIGSLLSQKKEPFIAAALGVYLHGRAGERASKKLGIYGVLASEICDFI